MTEKEFNIAFLELEEREKYFEFEYCGVAFWQVIRTQLHDFLKEKSKMGLQMTSNHINVLKVTRMYMGAVYNSISSLIRLSRIKTKKKFMIASNMGSTNPYLRVVMDKDIYDYYLYTTDYLAIGDKESDFNCSFLFFMSAYYRVLSYIVPIKKDKLYSMVNKIKKDFEAYLGITVEENYLYRIIKQYTKLFMTSIKFYSVLLNKCQPKYLLLDNGYSIFNYALVYVAKQKNIVTVEFQHGIANSLVVQYTYLNKEYENDCIPDYFLTFGDYWSKKVGLPNKCNVSAVGCCLYDCAMRKYSNIKKNDKHVVVFTNENTSDLIEIVADVATSLSDYGYYFYIKVHPREFILFDVDFSQIENSNVKIIKDEISAYELINSCKHCIGVSSTTLFENYEAGNVVHIFGCYSGRVSSGVEDLLEYPNVYSFRDSNELYNNITSSENISSKSINGFFYKNNAEENIHSKLREIAVDEDKVSDM